MTFTFRPRTQVPAFKFEFPSAKDELNIEIKEKTGTTIQYSELIGKEFVEPEKVKVLEKIKPAEREISLDEQMRKTVAGMLSNWEKHRHDFIKMHGIEKYEETYHMPPSFYE